MIMVAHLNSKEYKITEKNGVRYYAHRLKAGLKKKRGRKSKLVVDHVRTGAKNKKNNSRKNLRVVTRGTNTAKSNRNRSRR